MDPKHLIAPAGEVVLTLGVAFIFFMPGVCKNHLFCSAQYDLNCWCTVKPNMKKTKQQKIGKVLGIRIHFVNTDCFILAPTMHDFDL